MASKKILAMPEGDIFLKRDLKILSKYFEVRTASTFNRRKLIRSIPSIFMILKGTLWADLTLSQFADTHAFLAVLFSKIFRKKSIVIVGGYEVAKVPEIGYGAMLNPIYAFVIKFVLKFSDKVLTTADSLKDDAMANGRVGGENIKTVPECYDSSFWIPCEKKENLVMTIAYLRDSVIKRKGIETFVMAAEYLPEVKFVVAGPQVDGSINHLKSIAPPNVEFPGFISGGELPRWYSRAKVYCQLSRYEGLPNALCEAMLCECVPIGTEYCGIPVAIGDTGFYVPYGDVEATAEAIKKALKSNKGKEARERIKRMFPLERREGELVAEINELLEA